MQHDTREYSDHDIIEWAMQGGSTIRNFLVTEEQGNFITIHTPYRPGAFVHAVMAEENYEQVGTVEMVMKVLPSLDEHPEYASTWRLIKEKTVTPLEIKTRVNTPFTEVHGDTITVGQLKAIPTFRFNNTYFQAYDVVSDVRNLLLKAMELPWFNPERFIKPNWVERDEIDGLLKGVAVMSAQMPHAAAQHHALTNFLGKLGYPNNVASEYASVAIEQFTTLENELLKEFDVYTSSPAEQDRNEAVLVLLSFVLVNVVDPNYQA